MFWQILTSPTYWRSVFSGDAEIGYLWSIFLKEYGDPFTFGVMALTGVTFAGLVYIVLRYRRGFWGVALAVVAGVTFILQMALGASMPTLYENTGRGMPHGACPMLAFDGDGLLIMEESTIELNGREVPALVAKKNIFTVNVDPVQDELGGEERIGLLLSNTAVFGETFPRYCSIASNEAGGVVLDRIASYETPIDTTVLQELLHEDGLPFDVYWKLVKGELEVQDFAIALEKFLGHDLLPAYASDLEPMLRAMVEEVKTASLTIWDETELKLQADIIFITKLEEFESRTFNRAPLISLPGMPPYELLDPQQEEGDGKSEGEGDADGVEGGNGGQGSERGLAMLLELLESGAITLDQLNSMTDNGTASSEGSFGGVILPGILKEDSDRR